MRERRVQSTCSWQHSTQDRVGAVQAPMPQISPPERGHKKLTVTPEDPPGEPTDNTRVYVSTNSIADQMNGAHPQGQCSEPPGASKKSYPMGLGCLVQLPG